MDPVTKKLRPSQELREILLKKGVDPSDRVEKKLMCGTGVTAVVIDSALELAGFGGVKKVYDGSWTLVAGFQYPPSLYPAFSFAIV